MSTLSSWMARASETDDSVAEKLRVSRVHVSRLRRGVCRPSPSIAASLEALSGIPAWEFIKPDAKDEAAA